MRAVEVRAVAAVAHRRLAAVEPVLVRPALDDEGVQAAQGTGHPDLVEPLDLAAAHGPDRRGRHGVVVVGPSAAPEQVVPRLGGRRVLCVDLDRVPAPPVARVEAEGHEPGEAVLVDLLERHLEQAADDLVVAPGGFRQRPDGEGVDRLRGGEPLGRRPGAQRPVERRPERAVERGALGPRRQGGDAEGGEHPLVVGEPGLVVGEVHGEVPLARQAQGLRLVAVHALERHRHRSGITGDGEDAAVGLGAGGLTAVRLRLEAELRRALGAQELAHPGLLAGADAADDRRLGERADGNDVEAPFRLERQVEEVAGALDEHAVGLAVVRLDAALAGEVPLPLDGMAHDGGGRAGGEDVAPG